MTDGYMRQQQSEAVGTRERPVLPTGALPMVTGGDDLPVLALLFLGLVLAAKRRPALAGLVLGLSGTLKFTSWPVILLACFAVRDRDAAEPEQLFEQLRLY